MALEKEKRWKQFLLAAVLCCLADFLLYCYLGYSQYDIRGHWRICAYTLKGYNPFPLIGKKAILEEIGKIPSGFSTVPWACVFGNLFFAGFLPLRAAVVYIWVLHFAAYLFTAALVYRRWGNFLQRTERITVLLLLIGQFSFMYSLRYGNNGAIVCLLLFDAILLAETHPWIAGVLLGAAMMKPQIAAILCLVFLLNRFWKPVVLAAVIDLAGWLAASWMTSTGMLTLLKDCLSSGTASELQYLGLLSVLSNLGMSRMLVMGLNMLIGICYTLILWYYVKMHTDRKSIWYPAVTFVPACVASTFWMYKNGTDYLILALASVFFCLLIRNEAVSKRDARICMGAVLYLQMSRCLVYAQQLALGDSPIARAAFKGADGLVLLLIGIVFCRFWVKYAHDFPTALERDCQ